MAVKFVLAPVYALKFFDERQWKSVIKLPLNTLKTGLKSRSPQSGEWPTRKPEMRIRRLTGATGSKMHR